MRIVTSRRSLALLLALAGSTAPPAGALDDASRITGWLCGYTAFTDFTGLYEPDPDRFLGLVDAGPVTVTSDADAPAVSVTVTCSIQVGTIDPAAADDVTLAASGTGAAYLPPTAMTYRARITDDVYLCSRLQWTTRRGSFTHDWDYYPQQPGAQCCLFLCEAPGPDVWLAGKRR